MRSGRQTDPDHLDLLIRRVLSNPRCTRRVVARLACPPEHATAQNLRAVLLSPLLKTPADA